MPKWKAPEHLRPMVADIQRAAEHSARLTEQLVAFGRKSVYAPQVLELNAVLQPLQGMLRPLLGEDVEMVLQLDPALQHVRADRGQIEQVVSNLAVNSRDAMPGGGTITIRTENAGPQVQLTVQDTGSGIDPAILPHLFEPFFTTKEPGQGTGLGLSIVYGIVVASGGKVSVSSKPGVGTSVVISLPAVPREEVEPAPAAPPAAVTQRGTEHLMLVEDEAMLRSLTRHILESNGYRVTVAMDATDAMEQFDTSTDLLLTDVVMPDMSGPDLARELRKRSPHLRVLYMSGYTTHPAVLGDLKGDNSAFLPKPFTPGVLAQQVREALDQSAC
ncbi:MAG: ATP-binding protein [Candidatus Xenobia bacterium]